MIIIGLSKAHKHTDDILGSKLYLLERQHHYVTFN